MRLIRPLAFAFLVFLLDRITKIWVVEALDLRSRLVIDVWDPYFRLQMAWNDGINFGLFGTGNPMSRYVLIAIALMIVGGLMIWLWRVPTRMNQYAGGAIIGGAIGNVWDRISKDAAVADFLNFSCCGIDNPFSFNVADAAIFAGALVLVIWGETSASPASQSRDAD